MNEHEICQRYCDYFAATEDCHGLVSPGCQKESCTHFSKELETAWEDNCQYLKAEYEEYEKQKA